MYINIAKIDFGRSYRGESPGPVEEYYGMYITPADASAISVTPNNSYYTLHSKYLKYSLDGKTWNDWNGSVTVEPEQKMYLKGEDDYVWNSSTSGGLITADGYYNVGGDISSLTNEIADVKENTFYNLFSDDNYIKDASSLILSATTLASYCYQEMFWGCTSLTNAPELPATTLAMNCYSSMFHGCTALTTAPVLPATTLAPSCYSYMFQVCTSLYAAPELHATELADSCYQYMFSGCSSLTAAPELPATVLTNYCYLGMLSNCTSLTTAPELPATTLANNCYSSMFSNCTSLTTAPELPATTLAKGCYQYMFSGCSSLTNAPELPATTLANDCYYRMFDGCTSLTNAPELHATTLAESCYDGMFRYCTSLETAPELPATTLTYFCYAGMFSRCSKLNNITMLATDISESGCLEQWVNNVSSTGTFTKSPEMTSLPTGPSGIPRGWTVKDYTDYMTLSALGDGEITINIPSVIDPSYATSLSYSKDKSNWTDTIIDNRDQTISIPVTSGENVYLKGIAKQLGHISGSVKINSTANINASGNVMSLLYGDDYKDKVALPSGSSSTFAGLFSENTHLINAENLILPATTLVQYCYKIMFNGCTSLTTAPELPATTLADYCYESMFKGCTSLTAAPELHATTLKMYCYSRMFDGCTSLTTAPELPATTLDSWCYYYMFRGCKKLTIAPELPATTLTTYCYDNMFRDCTSLTTVPELPATTLVDYCYQFMFKGCTSLNNITMLATDISATDCMKDWVYVVASNGTFTKSPEMTSLPTGTSGIPEGWTVVDYVAGGGYSSEYMTLSALGDGEITITIPAGIDASYLTSLNYSKDKSTWTDTINDGTAKTITIPVTSGENVYLKGIGKQLYIYSVKNGLYISSDCNINVSGNIMSLLYGDNFADKTEFPEGSTNTFTYLFKNNTNLINAENLILPATTLTNYCYQNMFNGCTSLTSAPELPATTLIMYCYAYMFYNCSSLNSITMLATDISASNCLRTWVSGVSSTGTFTKSPEMTTLPTGASGIPEGWTVVDYVAA